MYRWSRFNLYNVFIRIKREYENVNIDDGKDLFKNLNMNLKKLKLYDNIL